jgi:hypothetical protein
LNFRVLPAKVRALWFAAFIISSVWFSYWICYDVFVWNKALTQVAPANYVGLVVSIVLTIIGTQLGKRNVPEELTSSPEQNVYEEETESQEAPEWEPIQPAEQVQQIQPAEEETESQQTPEMESTQPVEQVQQIQSAKEETESQQVPEWEQMQPEEETESQQAPELKMIEPVEQVQQIQPAEEETTQIPPGASVPPGCKFYLGYLNSRSESVEIPEECLACEHVVKCLSPTSNTIDVQAQEAT